MSKETILIVDDEKEIRNLIGIYLKNEGFHVLEACDGEEGLQLVKKHKVHLIVLDLMMPKVNGIEMCMKVREIAEMPIIMLTAKSQDMDKISGLTIGADDYVTKPFNPLELIARVKSQLRRYLKMSGLHSSNREELEVGDLRINTATHEVFVNNERVKLTPREFAILELLVSNPGIIMSAEQIYEKVWKEEAFQSENTVMVHIRKIRERIEANPRNPQYIKTVWGVGYKVEKVL